MLARLNYSVYIWHGVIVMSFLISRKHSSYLTNYEAMKMVCGFVLLINLLAVFISLLTEVPFMNLERILLMPE